MDANNAIAEAAARILADVCDPQTVNRAKSDDWKKPAWKALEDAGLPLAWVPEHLGGSGAGIADGFEVLRVAGRYATPLPLAETLLAGWLLARADIPVPNGALSCGPTRDRDRLEIGAGGVLNGTLRSVPFARETEHLAVLARRPAGGYAIALVKTDGLRLKFTTGVGGDPSDSVSFDKVRAMALKDVPGDFSEHTFLLMGAVARSMQMAGALESILATAVDYANERVAFERPIAKFQAVQHNLARLAGEAAVALSTAASAASAIAAEDLSSDGVFLEAASAKIRVGEAAGEGAGIAHQVLGAIGFTREHTLHRFTRRLWAWRDDFGNESFWAVMLGNAVAGKGAEGLWPLLAAR
jgi:acyl-CoA dehydrogenase